MVMGFFFRLTTSMFITQDKINLNISENKISLKYYQNSS